MRARRDALGRKRKPHYYVGRTAVVPIKLTPIGSEILTAAQKREQRSYGDILEHLLRLHGRDLRFSGEVTA